MGLHTPPASNEIRVDRLFGLQVKKMLDNGSSDADPSNVNSDPEEKCNQVGI